MPDPETVRQARKEEVLEMLIKAGQEVPTGTLSCKPLIIDTTSQDRLIFLFPQFLSVEWGQRQMEEVAASSLTASNVDLGLSWSPQGLLEAASSSRSSLLFLSQLINLPPRNVAEHRDNVAASGRQASLKSTSRRVAGRRLTGTHDWVREAAWGRERSGAMVPPHRLWGSVPEDLSGVGNEAQASSCCLVRPWLQLPPGG